MGPVTDIGTGMIPADCILDTSAKSGVPDAFETVVIRHVNGGKSYLTFKSFDQGRDAFESSEIELIHLDEEPPLDILVASQMRTMTVDGIVLVSFVPLQGMTELVTDFQSGYHEPRKEEKGDFRI
jgi:phage terminase large subunit-like protein